MYRLISKYMHKNKVISYKILEEDTWITKEVSPEEFAFYVGQGEVVNIKGVNFGDTIGYIMDEEDYRCVDEIDNEKVFYVMLYKLEDTVRMCLATNKKSRDGELEYLFAKGRFIKDNDEYKVHATLTADKLELIVLNDLGRRMENLVIMVKDPDHNDIKNSFNKFIDRINNYMNGCE